MTPKDFKRLVERDSYCLHCGEPFAVAPNHRANRGMGGSKVFDVPSNLVLLCSRMNGLIESDARAAEKAIRCGWKVSKWADWRSQPVLDAMTGEWWRLDDDWKRTIVENGPPD